MHQSEERWIIFLAHEKKLNSHSSTIYVYYYQTDNNNIMRHCDTTHTYMIRHVPMYNVYGRSMSVDPVREILLLTNSAAEIDNRPNNPIPYNIPAIPILIRSIYMRVLTT